MALAGVGGMVVSGGLGRIFRSVYDYCQEGLVVRSVRQLCQKGSSVLSECEDVSAVVSGRLSESVRMFQQQCREGSAIESGVIIVSGARRIQQS